MRYSVISGIQRSAMEEPVSMVRPSLQPDAARFQEGAVKIHSVYPLNANQSSGHGDA